MTTNNRIIYTKPGGIDSLKLIEEPIPVAGANEVLIKVSAVGVAYGDVLLRVGVIPGFKFPVTPGYDIVGNIVAIGPGATKFKAGDYVGSYCGTGGYTTYICLLESKLVTVPDHLTPAEAVVAILNYTTAYELLIKVAGLKAGDSALMHGAAGGVGTAVLQLAKIYGIKIYGTVSTAKIPIVEKEGGIPIDYTKKDFVKEIKRLTGKGVDAVFDPISGTHLFRSDKVLNAKGTLIWFGASSTVAGEGNPILKLIKSLIPYLLLKLTPSGKHYKLLTKTTGVNEDIATMFKLLGERKIKPIIAKIFPLKEAAKAQTMLEKERPVGKIILEP